MKKNIKISREIRRFRREHERNSQRACALFFRAVCLVRRIKTKTQCTWIGFLPRHTISYTSARTKKKCDADAEAPLPGGHCRRRASRPHPAPKPNKRWHVHTDERAVAGLKRSGPPAGSAVGFPRRRHAGERIAFTMGTLGPCTWSIHHRTNPTVRGKTKKQTSPLDILTGRISSKNMTRLLRFPAGSEGSWAMKSAGVPSVGGP